MSREKFSVPSGLSISTLVALTIVAFVSATAISAHAQTFTVLHNFPSVANDGRQPEGSLVLDNKGNLYGTTYSGGTADSSNYGTVFELSPDGTETLLHSFFYSVDGLDGEEPSAGLVLDSSGNLYGTTSSAGTDNAGVIFKIDSTGTETILHDFSWGGSDGAIPGFGNLIMDSSGNLYGTTEEGGTFNNGSVFKLDASGVETVLYSFTGKKDGGYPIGGLVMDSAGNLYGTTDSDGAFGYGVVFKLDTSGVETVLHSFKSGAPSGEYPNAGLILSPAGHFYGTASDGGALGCGTVFEISTSGQVKVLHTFAGSSAGDGCSPGSPLVLDAGNLYGTTRGGGAFGGGIIFEVTGTGTETVLHSFDPATDGGTPVAGLVRGPKGVFYGTTVAGGLGNFGTVFKIVP